MKTNQYAPFLAALLLLSTAVEAQKAALNTIGKGDLEAHMAFFASDELKGRETGTRENEVAALYLKTNLMRMGVQPVPETGDYFQMVPLFSSYLSPQGTGLGIRYSGEQPEYTTDSLVFLIPPSNTGDLAGNVVFAGYGYRNADGSYDDLEGIDLAGKIVLIMKESPLLASRGESSPMTDFSVENPKIMTLFGKNPKALLYAYNPKNRYADAYDSGLSDMIPGGKVGSRTISATEQSGYGIPFPVAFITRQAADRLLETSGYDLAGLEEKIIAGNKPLSFDLEGTTATLNATVETSGIRSPNVIGMIEGSDPVLRNECILYTAHFDHVGVNGKGEVLNGADDNASGSMALLEIAEAFMSLKKKPLRTIIFAWVNAEEKGLLGSRFYADHPVISMENTVVNLNFDMVGRSRMDSDTGQFMGFKLDVTQPGEIMVYTAHESTELLEVMQSAADRAGVHVIDMGKELEFGGSDHESFTAKGVPALFFHSGVHSDLHAEGDEVEKIDFDKMEKVSRMAFLLGYQVANQRDRIALDGQ